MINSIELRDILNYCPITGLFFWKKKIASKVVIGTRAGCIGSDGYVRLRIEGVLYLGHRLAWLHHYGEPMPALIDHRDGFSNRIENLRAATRHTNAWNSRPHISSSSQFKGVSWSAEKGRWRATICEHRRQHHLGYFDDERTAANAYAQASRKYHGEYGRTT